MAVQCVLALSILAPLLCPGSKSSYEQTSTLACGSNGEQSGLHLTLQIIMVTQ